SSPALPPPRRSLTAGSEASIFIPGGGPGVDAPRGGAGKGPAEPPGLDPPTEEARMRIAQVSPLYESVPPKLYGGTERVVWYLTEELVRQGHQVTLFASGDSETSAELVAACPRALRLGN